MIEALASASGTGSTPSRFRVRFAPTRRLLATIALTSAICAAATTASADEPPQSWVRFELDVPLDLVRDEIERRSPASAEVTRRITLAEGYVLELEAKRGAYEISAHRDTLFVRTRVPHSLHVHGDGLKRTGCDGLIAEVTCVMQWGWNEALGLEASASDQGLVFPKRCKPDPPRINLLKRSRATMHELFVDPLVQTAAEVAPSIKAREYVTAVWDALAPGLLLGDGWVDFAPDAVFVDPIAFSGDALAIRGAVRVRPELRAGRPQSEPAAFPATAPTRVRLSGRDLGVTIHVAGDLARTRQRLQAAVDSAFAGEFRVEKTTLHTSATGVDVHIDIASGATGRITLRAPLEYEDPPAIVARDPVFTETTQKSMAGLDAARRERLALLLPIVAQSTRIDLNESVATTTRDLGANLQRRLGEGLVLSGVLHNRRLLGVTGAGDNVSVALLLSGPAVIRPFAANP